MKRPILVFCTTLGGRHAWRWVTRRMATGLHRYDERQCWRCYVYESEIR